MVESAKKSDGIDVGLLRVKIATLPGTPSCSVHPEYTGAEHTFMIHSRGSKDQAQTFCPKCQRDIMMRLLRDYLTFPGLKELMFAGEETPTLLLPAAKS